MRLSEGLHCISLCVQDLDLIVSRMRVRIFSQVVGGRGSGVEDSFVSLFPNL